MPPPNLRRLHLPRLYHFWGFGSPPTLICLNLESQEAGRTWENEGKLDEKDDDDDEEEEDKAVFEHCHENLSIPN